MPTIPTIAVFSKATVPLGIDLDKLIAALQIQVDRDFAPIWGTPCKLLKASDFIRGAWSIVFFDDADQPGALAYHDVGPDGLPISKVFVKTILANGETAGSATSHELLEMLADPSCALCVNGADGKSFYGYEVCDAVEETGYKINGVDVSNFVYPAAFETYIKPKSAKFDYLGLTSKPLQILKGGYLSVFKSGRWSEIFGSKLKAKRFAREDRRGHRTEVRKRKRVAA